MRHLNINKIFIAAAILMGCMLPGFGAQIPAGFLEEAPYVENFTKNPVSSSKFNPPSGWSNYTDGTTASYVSESHNGGYAIGVSTDQVARDLYNMIVTPQISGEMTFKVRRYAYSDYYKFNLEFYRLTKNEDGSFTYDVTADRIPWESPYNDTSTGNDWNEELQTIDVGSEYTYVGIRLSYAYIGDISATSALLPIVKALEISSVQLLPGYSSNISADEDGNISIGLKVTLKNTGNVELSKATEGDKWNYTIAHYTSSWGNPYTYVPLYTADLPTLPAGSEPTEFEVRAKMPAPTSGELQSDGSLSVRLDFIENYSDKEVDSRYKTAGWYNIMSNKGVMDLTYERKTSYTNKETVTVDPNTAIYAGAIKGTREFTFKMRNRGVGNIVIESIETPDWISFNGMEVGTTISGGNEKDFTVVVGGAPGHKEGKVKFNFDGISIVNEIKIAADVIGTDEYLADFESNDALDGWYQPVSDNAAWSVKEYTSDERKAKVNVAEYGYNDKKMENGRRATPGYAIYSPKLDFAEGELLSFWAAKRYNSGSDVFLEVKYSDDRANWHELGTITVNNADESLRFYCSNPDKPTSDGKDMMKHFSFEMPQGSYYISLSAGYVTVDNFHGGKLSDVAYDIISEKANAGKTRLVNNPLSFTAEFKNLSAKEVPAENQTVSLYANGVKVATAEPQAIQPQETGEFSFTYVPHTAGETNLYAEMSIGDYAVTSPSVTVEVKEESAEEVTAIGEVTKTENFGPVYPSYNYSKSEFIYTADDLGLAENAKILKISYPYYKTEAEHSAPQLTIWMENTEETVVGETFINTENLTEVFHPKRYTYPTAGSSTDLVELEFSLDEPFLYDGTNLRIVVESRGSDPKWQRCNFGLDYSDDTRLMRYYAHDTESVYDNNKYGSGTSVKGIPVINIYTQKDVLNVAGTVKDENGVGIAGANVKADAKDSEVYYETTTDEDGAWSMQIFQSNLEYSVTASAEGYVTSEPAELLTSGSNDIVLAEEIFGPSAIIVKVSAVTEASTKGLVVTLAGEENGFVFDPMKVNSDGIVRFSYVPSGIYTLTIDGSPMGLEKYVDRNLKHNGEQTVSVVLKEAVRNPYALNAVVEHDEFTGEHSAMLTWNRETDYFYDDFESYEPFAIEFTPWTGYDIDKEPAVEIQGLYPNRGIPQYATIFNPLTINPPVYYEYEVLRPYSGKQCVGFVRTRSGNANNDWLISPKVKVGVNNVVSFMAKASETVPDRFAVLVSRTGTELSDFVQLTQGNYETVDYKGWKDITYSLADYEGEDVYVAIHCVSQNSFMFMVDDFYVGPAALPRKARRVNRRSAENPNEVFSLTIDGKEVGKTEDYNFTFRNLQTGNHTLGVTAEYVTTRSEESQTEIYVPEADSYASLDIQLISDVDDIDLLGQKINLMNIETGRLTTAAADNEGKATIGYLAKGNYLVNVESEVFDTYTCNLEFTGDATLEINLVETIQAPYNLDYVLIPQENDNFDVELTWNRNLGFRESFEDYDDFTQEIGDWTTLDLDMMPTYAFSIGGVEIKKPESRGLVGAMVFNPYTTEPVEAAEDGLFLAPDGDKYVMFNSAEKAFSDDWLISPTVKIGKNFVLKFSAKSYQDLYAGSFEFCALRDKDITNPTILDSFYLTEEWMRYEIPLQEFEGENIEIGFHHNTYDGWISFIDDVYIGPSEETEADDAATRRCTFDVYLDGEFVANVSEPVHTFKSLKAATYKAGVQALYPSGKKSDVSEITFTVSTNGIVEINSEESVSSWQWYDVNGLRINSDNLRPGIYIRSNGTKIEKVMVR